MCQYCVLMCLSDSPSLNTFFWMINMNRCPRTSEWGTRSYSWLGETATSDRKGRLLSLLWVRLIDFIVLLTISYRHIAIACEVLQIFCLCSALMDIELWGIIIVPYLWRGTSGSHSKTVPLNQVKRQNLYVFLLGFLRKENSHFMCRVKFFLRKRKPTEF